MLTLIAQAADIFGTVEAPPGVAIYDAGGEIGLLVFVSNAIKLATVLAGLWVFFNFIKAGFIFLKSSGDSSAYGKVAQNLTMSVVGLILIIAAYTITGIISLIFFGSAGYILNPTIEGPGSSPATTQQAPATRGTRPGGATLPITPEDNQPIPADPSDVPRDQIGVPN